MFAWLVTLDGFHLLLSTQLTADLTPEWSAGSMFHPLSHIYTKTPFCCIKIVANNGLSRWRVFVFDRLWANTTPTLDTAFLWINVHAKWWIHCLLIFSTPLLSHTTSTYNRPKRVRGVFFMFSRTTAEFGRSKRSASFVSVRQRFKSAYHHFTVVSDGAEAK